VINIVVFNLQSTKDGVPTLATVIAYGVERAIANLFQVLSGLLGADER
jgi:hypothetical protein